MATSSSEAIQNTRRGPRILLLALVALQLAGASSRANPMPSIDQAANKQQELAPTKVEPASPTTTPATVGLVVLDLQTAQEVNTVQERQTDTKTIRRGLSKFFNLNPAPFFIPAPMKGPLASEPAAIVNADQTADVLIKGPNQMRQSRPIGGPLRWGR